MLNSSPFLALIACSVIVGICTILAGAKLQSTYKRGWLLIASGLLRAVFVLPFGIFALMMIVAGAIEIAAAIRLRKHVTGTIFLALAGIFSMLLVPSLVFLAGLATVQTFQLLGGFTIISGVCSLAFGLTMRSSRPGAT